MRWVTNCSSEDAFEYLMRYSAENPEKSFTIGRPKGTEDLVFDYDGIREFDRILIPSRGFTVAELETMDYRAIYECDLQPGRDNSDI